MQKPLSIDVGTIFRVGPQFELETVLQINCVLRISNAYTMYLLIGFTYVPAKLNKPNFPRTDLYLQMKSVIEVLS
jgi:hypothetical protein